MRLLVTFSIQLKIMCRETAIIVMFINVVDETHYLPSTGKLTQCNWLSCIKFVGNLITMPLLTILLSSVLWRHWLGGRKGIQPAKNWVVGCMHGYVNGMRCRFTHGLADANATQYLLLQ